MGLFKTAVRAGVAAKVIGNVQRRQSQQWAAQDAAAAASAPAPVVAPAPVAAPFPAAAAAPAVDTDVLIRQLTELGQLRDQGILTPDEFEAQKSRLLAAR